MKTQHRHFIILLAIFLGNASLAFAQERATIYFDLAAGNITINASTYTGYRWKTVSGTTTKETVTGAHSSTNEYYVYQSQDDYSSDTDSYKTTTGNQNGTIVVPTYDDVYIGEQKWEEYITNNTDVNAVNSNWETTASATYRTPTTNFITLNGDAEFNLTIDNLYCNHGTNSDGSIYIVEGVYKERVNIKLKNTSKLVKVFYNRLKNGSTTYTGYLKFWSSDGDGHTNNGSLTLTIPSTITDIGHFTLIGSGTIAGGDGDWGPAKRQVAGVYFEGGTIYAGLKDGGSWNKSSHCRCVIGGIGAYGEMYIHGGRLTAVGYDNASATIGGGGGMIGQFGPAKVEITGGEVYAYNFGATFNSSSGYNGVARSPAIGGGVSGAGGGSDYNWTYCGQAEVAITGGTVYAQSVGGPAIGGGSSFYEQGGDATVSISGDAHVTAVSLAGTINGTSVSATAAIAGGNTIKTTITDKQPGKVNLTVGGTATLITGSIAGGKTGSRIGKVDATINGGTVQGQFVLSNNLYPTSDYNTFTMTGGTIDNTNLPAVGATENPRLYAPGGAIYSNGAKDVINISGGTITHCSATTGGAIYLGAGTLTLSGGTITGNTATTNGGGVYKLGSMMVSGAPIVKGNTAVGKANNVYIPSAAAEKYILYTNGAMGCGAQIGVTKKEGEHTYSTLSGSVKYTNITKEITVTTSEALPFYPEYTKRKYRSEFVIPQDGLSTAMKGKAIKKMTFHLNTHASASWGSPQFLVYMLEVDYTTFGSAYRTGVASATGDVTTKVNVRENSTLGADITGETMDIVFNSSNYTYQGGNLFVGFLKTQYNASTNTNRTGVTFSGIAATSAGVSGTKDDSSGDPTFHHRNFLPKVTFTMTDNSTWTFPDDCYTGIGTACTNHFFFDDTQACQVCSQSYNAALSPFTLYFVKNAEGDNSWLRQAPNAVATGASPDYTLASDGIHVASIHTNTGLAYFASEVLSGKDYAGQTVTLTNDIDLTGHNWEPAGFCAACGDAGTTTFAGTFDGQGHSIYNLNSSYDYKNMGLFGHVTGTVKNVVINGTVNGSGTTNLGGIAGELGSGGAIYNTMASVSLSGGTTMGGLVGNIASGGSLKNSYAHTSATNGLVGSNAGTVENCYVLGTTGLAGSGSVTNCYASTDGTDGDFTAVDNPYVYGPADNVVSSTSVPLVKTLNNWVNLQSGTDYAQWGRPHTTVINGDYPILKMNDQEAVASDGTNLYYGTANGMLGTHTASGEAIYLYKSVDDVNSNYGSSAELYIDEDVALTQSSSKADGDLTATVGVTLKNTQPSDASSWDWHMFSPALTAAPLGVEYPNNDRVPYGDDPDFDFVNPGYFPTITAANYGQIDYYCYFEPEYHWINLKRNGNSHWHEDAPDGVHEHIDYKATPTATVNVNESALVPGKGYLLATKQETLLQCEGVLNNTDVSIAVTTEGDYRTGYNLIGNPYQSYYDFNVFASDNGSLWGGTSNASYILLSGDSYTPYVYNASNNELEAPRWLHPHQGFMIVASNSGTATFYNSKRITEGYSEFRDERPNYALVNLIATDEDGKRDFTTVELGRPDRGGALKAYDLHLGKGCIYTHYEDEDYSIAFTQPGLAEVGIRFEADEEATFTMTWGTQNGDFDYLHLKDNITGTDIDCLTTEEYRFTATPDDYKSRFRLMFGYTGIEEPEVPEPVEGPTSFAFQMGSQLVVNGEGYLEMIDMLGRIVRTETLHGSQSMVSMPHGTTGVYVLRLTSKGVTRVQKIVVN